jgi:hypothetical protein
MLMFPALFYFVAGFFDFYPFFFDFYISLCLYVSSFPSSYLVSYPDSLFTYFSVLAVLTTLRTSFIYLFIYFMVLIALFASSYLALFLPFLCYILPSLLSTHLSKSSIIFLFIPRHTYSLMYLSIKLYIHVFIYIFTTCSSL